MTNSLHNSMVELREEELDPFSDTAFLRTRPAAVFEAPRIDRPSLLELAAPAAIRAATFTGYMNTRMTASGGRGQAK